MYGSVVSSRTRVLECSVCKQSIWPLTKPPGWSAYRQSTQSRTRASTHMAYRQSAWMFGLQGAQTLSLQTEHLASNQTENSLQTKHLAFNQSAWNPQLTYKMLGTLAYSQKTQPTTGVIGTLDLQTEQLKPSA